MIPFRCRASVIQSNASNAEETAAAAEELNAQSLTLKEAVAELQQLVGGAAESPGHSDAVSPTIAAPKAKAAPARNGATKPAMAGKLTPPARDHSEHVVATAGKASGHDDFFKNS